MSGSDRVRVRVKVGSAEVEIECDRSVVEQTVKQVVSALQSSMPSRLEQPSTTQTPLRTSKRGLTCRDVVAALYDEGWFSESRSLGQVSAELSRRGYNYDSTAVAHVLLDLVRQNILTRTGTSRRYRYVQRTPPEGSETLASPRQSLDRSSAQIDFT
ncbi:MAG: hypothetical protein ACETV0_07955 [Nitrososphaeria archaeon]